MPIRRTKMGVLHTRMQLTDVPSEELLSTLKSLVDQGNRLTARIIAYLAEVETRRLHLEAACPSMFEYCTRRLGLSESETFRRLAVARLVRRFPCLLEALASGRIHLSNLVLLRELFTEANVDELVAEASGKTKRQVQ